MKLLVREPKKMPEIKLFGKWSLENIEIEWRKA
jgi:hypothetical protein